MKNYTILMLLLASVTHAAPIATKIYASAQTHAIATSALVVTSSPYRVFARAIAKSEGFFIKGSIPNRNHNPGDLKGVAFPGQIGIDVHGHAIFKNDYWGWAALDNQVRRMCEDSGSRYNPAMTLEQIGHRYARDWRRWAKNVSHEMNCKTDTTLMEIFQIPPAVKSDFTDYAKLQEVLQ